MVADQTNYSGAAGVGLIPCFFGPDLELANQLLAIALFIIRLHGRAAFLGFPFSSGMFS